MKNLVRGSTIPVDAVWQLPVLRGQFAAALSKLPAMSLAILSPINAAARESFLEFGNDGRTAGHCPLKMLVNIVHVDSHRLTRAIDIPGTLKVVSPGGAEAN